MPVAPVSPGDLRRGLDEIVVYPAGTKLMLHPALQIDAELYTQYPSQLKLGPEPYREHWDKYWKRVDARALQRRTPLHQFATLPPVMSMSLRTTSVDGNEVAASLYVSEGIRLGDMENLARRMLQADGVYASASVTISLAAKDVSACTT